MSGGPHTADVQPRTTAPNPSELERRAASHGDMESKDKNLKANEHIQLHDVLQKAKRKAERHEEKNARVPAEAEQKFEA